MAGLLSSIWTKYKSLHRVLTVMSYPFPFFFQSVIYWPPTRENATFFKRMSMSIWFALSSTFYYASYQGMVWSTWQGACVKHFVWFYAVDIAMLACVSSAHVMEKMFSRTTTNRLFGEKKTFNGKKICVLGNGPSLVKGEPLGKYIDSMDEVVRFNNFQTKTSGLEEFTGSKTTVHFSDSMLYPSYPEYNVPGATLALSLFMDRLLVAGSYFIFRGSIDLCYTECLGLLLNPALGWVSHEDINNLKKTLGISHWKHPTSGALAIDWMVRNRPDQSVPVYIHGFDFFEGAEIHYYNKTEPLYERLNDMIGVKSMHQPEKEKAFVAKLVQEGKVKWLKDSTGDFKK